MGIVAALAVPDITAMMQRRAATIEVEEVKSAFEAIRDDARAQMRCMQVTNPTLSSLHVNELEVVANACTATVLLPRPLMVFGASAGALNLTFNASGALDGAGADPFLFIVKGKFNGTTQPYTFSIFRTLGLVRK